MEYDDDGESGQIGRVGGVSLYALFTPEVPQFPKVTQFVRGHQIELVQIVCFLNGISRTRRE